MFHFVTLYVDNGNKNDRKFYVESTFQKKKKKFTNIKKARYKKNSTTHTMNQL